MQIGETAKMKVSVICVLVLGVLNALISEVKAAAAACDVCKNGGHLSTSSDDLLCICPPGFTGKLCEQPSCLNGGKTVSVDGNLECQCPAGFVGDRCQTNLDDCGCQNGGKLVNDYDARDFYCICPDPYFGPRCETECPSNFTIFTGGDAKKNNKVGCYNIVNSPRTWNASQQFCQSLNPAATLVVIANTDENEAIKDHIRKTSDADKKPCQTSNIAGPSWLMASQRIKPGDCSDRTYVWRPIGLPQTNITFSDWEAGQPDCNSSPGLQSESCGSFWQTYNFQWNDVACDFAFCSVCEVPAQ